ncbi:unnamed protein product [Peniophora sp. CBMAI 1063]|nr:unnamed protein product [Peniophora sp. CBMAI 1063]
MRGSDRPGSVAWARPFLPEIKPLSLDNAMQIWDAICDGHDDDSIRLAKAVDCVPLAVSLLAALARNETSKTLWSRWCNDYTKFVKTRGSRDRLSSLDISIGLSVHGSRLRDRPEAVLLLSIICFLPQGMRESRSQGFADAFIAVVPNLQASVALLKQCSLIYLSEDGFLRALSPIVHYMRADHTVPDLVFTKLADFYYNIVESAPGDPHAATAYTQEHIRAEVGNITSVLWHGLEAGAELLRPSLRAVLWFVQHCHRFQFYGLELLEFAIGLVRDEDLEFKSPLLLARAEGLYLSTHFEEAIPAFSQVCELYRAHGDLPREGVCLARLGDVYYWRGEYGLARDSLLMAMSILEDTDAIALCQLHLGIIYTVTGQLAQAETLLTSAHESFAVDQSGSCMEICLWALGTLHTALYQFDRAERELTSSRQLSKTAGNVLNEAICLQSLGHLFVLHPVRLHDAEEPLKRAQTLYDGIGNQRGVAECLGRLGQLYAQTDKLDRAEDCLQSAVKLYDGNVDHPLGRVTALNCLGTLYRVLKKYDEARALHVLALRLSSGMAYAVGQGDAHLSLGKVQGHQGYLREAAESFRGALNAFERAQDPQKAWLAREYLEGVLRRL